MSITVEEKEFIRALPKRLEMCPKLQAEKDKKLHAALLAEFNDADIADRAMRIIKGGVVMKILIILLALLPYLSYAGDCEKLAAFQKNQERKLREDYMTKYVPRDQWLDFMRASDRVLQDRYQQRVDICKEELEK